MDYVLRNFKNRFLFGTDAVLGGTLFLPEGYGEDFAKSISEYLKAHKAVIIDTQRMLSEDLRETSIWKIMDQNGADFLRTIQSSSN